MIINVETGLANYIEHGRGLYYGIAYSEDEVFVAARRSVITPKELRDKESGVILVFGYDMVLRDILTPPFPLRDMHQIAYFDKKLWVTCAFDDMVAIYDGANWQKWYPRDRKDDSKDYYHFNSIYYNNSDLYILAHNYGPSEVFKFRYSDLELKDVFVIGNKSHNIWESNGYIYTCDSDNGKIVNNNGWEKIVGKFPRGMAVTSQLCIVGLSEEFERSQRGFTTSSILILDQNWNVKSEILLPKEGLILEIRVPGHQELGNPTVLGEKLMLSKSEAIKLPFVNQKEVPGVFSFLSRKKIIALELFNKISLRNK